MNDPNKRIDVNLSSLLSLKAELLRKQSEVTKAKSTHVVKNFQQTIKPKQKKIEKKPEKKHEELEDSATFEKSKRILEAKSKYYDRMCALGGTVNSEDTSLVMFNQKKQISSMDSSPPRRRHYSSSSDGDDDKDNKYDDDKLEEGWVEYTDCLGRTRKCLIEDLEYFKKKDAELVDTVNERKESLPEQNNKLQSSSEQSEIFKQPADLQRNADDNQSVISAGGGVDGDGSIIGGGDAIDDDDTMSLLSKTSKIEEMRTNWERQEAENADKEFVHYQDILFDEARTHGVGYYAFSTDDLERSKQRDQLDELREKTLDAQKKRDEQRQARASIVEQRVRAAKNRQRARLGLPPLEDEPPKEPEKPTEALANKNDKKSRKEKRKLAKKEAEERRRVEEREQHIRPWDKGKDGVSSSFINRSDSDNDDDDDSRSPSPEWSYKPEKEPMSQEKWNELQRNERKNEFAPPTSLQQPSYHTVRPPPPHIPPPYQNFRRQQPPPQTYQQFHQQTPSTSTENQSFMENKNETRKRKPFVVRHIDDQDNNDDAEEERGGNRGGGTEIPPPPTFDYYGPSSSKYPKAGRSVKPEVLETSIAAGLKFLREQSDKGAHTTKQKWTTTQDY